MPDLTPEAIEAAASDARTLLGALLVENRASIVALFRASRERLEDAVEFLFRHYVDGDSWDWATIRASNLWPQLHGRIEGVVNEMQAALAGVATADGAAVWGASGAAAGELWGVEPTFTAMGLFPEALTTEWAGSTVFDRFLNITEGLGEDLLQQTRTSALAGETFEEWTARIRDVFGDARGLFRPKASAYGAVRVWENEARRLWNEMNTATAEAAGAEQMWWTHSLFMPEVQTTPGCAARHGRLRSELPETAQIPAHINCKCEWITVDPGADLGELRALKADARERADDWAFEHFEDAWQDEDQSKFEPTWRRSAREAWRALAEALPGGFDYEVQRRRYERIRAVAEAAVVR